MSNYAKTQYNRYRRAKRAMLDIVERAKSYKLTHERMLELRATLFETKDWKKLTQGERFAILEVFRYACDQLYRHDLTWRLGPAEGPLPEGEKWEEGSALSKLALANELFGGHFWTGTEKPFNGYHSLWSSPHSIPTEGEVSA